jgi:hypothetical protein
MVDRRIDLEILKESIKDGNEDHSKSVICCEE